MNTRRPHTEVVDEYYKNLLLVQVKTNAQGVQGAAAVVASAAASGVFANTVGTLDLDLAVQTLVSGTAFGALEALCRAGRIKRVTPISRKSANRRAQPWTGLPGVATAALFAGTQKANPTRGESIADGVSMVEVDDEASVDRLRDALATDPNIVSASRVPLRYMCGKRVATTARSSAATPPAGSGSSNWNLQKIRWAEARQSATFIEADDIKVAVLDTGVDRNHPDLSVAHYEWFPNEPGIVTSESDIVGHGTHVAGTIAARIGNGVGIAGVCQPQLHVWKIFDDEPRFVGSRFAYLVNPILYLRALSECLDAGVDVVNLSIGGRGKPSALEQQALNALLADDVVIVAAMGNERAQGSPVFYPAAIQDVVAVGATRPDDRVANFSNRGGHITLAAPGVAIWSTLPTKPGQTGFEASLDTQGVPQQGKRQARETDYDAWDGTSMATPHVAAAVALTIAKQRRQAGDSSRLKIGDLKDLLTAACDRTPAMGNQAFHTDYGAGRLNIERLLA
jgi:subtilisin family serine protease